LGLRSCQSSDKNGDRLSGFRNEMEARTRSFDHYPPTPNPVAEAVWYLDKIQEALNVAACESGLNAPAADAWLLCAKANAALEKERQFSKKTADMIESASKALVAALMLPPLLKDSHMSAAAIKCNRAAMFARQYGPKAERGAREDVASEAAARRVVAYIASDKVTITHGNPATDLELHGHLTQRPDYRFAAKVSDVGSEYGIEGGRILKLEVMRKGNVIMSFDRGWDQTPRSWKDRAVLKDLIAGFPSLGESDDGHSAQRQKIIKSGRGF
jgi:hypothetical protein